MQFRIERFKEVVVELGNAIPPTEQHIRQECARWRAVNSAVAGARISPTPAILPRDVAEILVPTAAKVPIAMRDQRSRRIA
jgi:hypothetical protein